MRDRVVSTIKKGIRLMNLSEIDTLGISQWTKQNLDIDVTKAIIDDEFYKQVDNELAFDDDTKLKKSYRERAIDRLINLKLPFHSECNIARDLISRSIIMVCPYCKSHMKQGSDSGTMEQTTACFQCPSCNSTGSLTFPSDGIKFHPSK
jgi:hypothetical protein